MNRFRHSLLALTSAAFALLSMLLVATAATASSPPGHEVAGMVMSSDMPCEPEQAVCATDCAVLCQLLLVQAPIIDQPAVHSRATYRLRATALGSLSVEAEDPPPR